MWLVALASHAYIRAFCVSAESSQATASSWYIVMRKREREKIPSSVEESREAPERVAAILGRVKLPQRVERAEEESARSALFANRTVDMREGKKYKGIGREESARDISWARTRRVG